METTNPLDLDNWEFYVVPTTFLDENCGDNKTITLGRIRNFGFQSIKYSDLKREIDKTIENMK